MWALIYDYMITLLRWRTCRPSPAWPSRGRPPRTASPGPSTSATGVTWSDGEPLTADDIAYTYNRILDGGPEGATWGSYLDVGQDGRGARRHDRRADARQAERRAAAAADPDRARAHLEGRPREGDQDLRRRADRRPAGRRLRAVPARRGHGRRLDVPLRGEPRLLAGRAAHRRGRLPRLQERGPGDPGADQGRGRLRRGHQRRSRWRRSRARTASPRTRRLAGLRRDRLQHRRRSTPRPASRSATPTRPLQDPTFRHALGYAIDRDQIIERPTRAPASPATRSSRRPTPTATGTRPTTRRSPSTSTRPASCSTRPATRSATTASGRMPDGEPIGTLRLFARTECRPRSTSMDFFSGVARRPRHRLRDLRAMESNKLTNVILDGEFDAFEWGWYVEPDPDSMLCYMTCDQRGNWSDSWYCNEEYDALYDEQNGATDDADARGERQADAGDPLRGLALPGDGLQHASARRSAATGSPASSRSRTRAASGCSSTASTTTSTSGRPPRPATATASTTALGRRRRDAPGGAVATATEDGGSALVMIGGGVLLGALGAGAAAAGRCGAGRPPPTASDRRRRRRRAGRAGGGGRRRQRRSYGRYVAGKVGRRPRQPGLRAGAELLPVPGAARRPGAHAGPRPVPHRGAARGVQRSTYGLDQPLPQQFLTYPEEHRSPATSASRCATGCRSPT